jgi:hypothetical protein
LQDEAAIGGHGSIPMHNMPMMPEPIRPASGVNQ